MDHHQIINSINDPVVIMDMDAGHFVDCNDLALKLFDFSKEELLQTNPSKLSPSNVYGHDAEAYSRQLMQEALAGANPAFDWIHVGKDGKELPCEVRLMRIPPFDRNLVRGTIIHKEDKNRIVRRASESRLILTLESAEIGTFDWFPQVDQLTWDKRLYEIFELDPNSKIDLNAHFFSVIHPDDIDRASSTFEKSLQPGGPDHNRIEYRIVIDGRVKHLLAYSRMIRDDKGEVIRMLGTTQDISVLRESEKRLKEHEELLDSIIQDQKEMIVRWKPGGYRTFVNKAYCEAFDLDPQKAIGESVFAGMEKSVQNDIKKKIEGLTPENPVRTTTIHRPMGGGEMVWQEWSDRAYFDKQGNVIEYQSVGRDITVQKENEQKHLLMSQRLKAISDNLPGVVLRYKLNPDFTDEMVFVSDGVRDLLGVEVADAISDINNVWSKFHPEDIEIIKQSIQESYVNMTRWYGEWRVYLADGTIGWVQGTGQPKKEADGSVIWDSVIMDITPQIQIKKDLEKSENLFRSIVQDQDEMIVRWKPGGIRTFVNQAYLDFYGQKKEEVLGTSFYDLISPEDRERVKLEIEALTPANPSRENVHSVILPAGKKGWQRWKDRAFFDENGKPVEYQSVGADITQIVEAEKALKENEERYRNVFNQQFQFTALLDLNGKVVHINDLPLKVQGLKREDYLGKYFWDSPGWQEDKEWQKKIKSQVLFAKKTGETLTVEDLYFGLNNSIRWAMASYSVIKNSKGEIENILVQAMDITEEKNAKKEIEDRQKKLSLIFDNANDFMILFRVEDKKLFIESVNEETLKGFKNSGIELSEDDLIGLEIREYFQKVVGYDEETMAFHMEKYKEALKNKETITYISDNMVNDLYFAIETKITPVEESNKANYLLTTSRDITEIVLSRKELEGALDEVRGLKNKLEQENVYLKEEIKQANDFEDMVFKSKAFRGVLQKVEQVAKTDATVLITGETGTGKELIARAIHNVSKRSEMPLIKVNTAAIPKDLIESELFGHEKGAFTGASAEKPGKFELADGGTIFLDEIGDMPLDLQVKILRVLQEGEVERLGSTKTKKIDVRIISATNKDLEEAVKNGTFREDLYFRLKVFPIEIPPLRSRPEDVPILVEHFIEKYGIKYSNPIKIIPKPVMDYLRNYAWPGNVRELENTIERAVILSSNEKLHLPEVVDSTVNQEQWEHDNSLDVIVENHIRRVLKECDWKVEGGDGAAAKLKIKPSTLRDRMRKFSIKRPN
ncbi:sigma 54-interacting transcriptional regulator [Ekhidna sp. MALMAid0563]|uniref:sigma 54-interacting transcriptional regulator n=1 Tax=Ekhidna sp. MALMAid0563 TaxID=3143937 RepID=UPI0032DE8C5F